jgi:hypothetical protein
LAHSKYTRTTIRYPLVRPGVFDLLRHARAKFTCSVATLLQMLLQTLLLTLHRRLDALGIVFQDPGVLRPAALR